MGSARSEAAGVGLGFCGSIREARTQGVKSRPCWSRPHGRNVTTNRNDLQMAVG